LLGSHEQKRQRKAARITGRALPERAALALPRRQRRHTLQATKDPGSLLPGVFLGELSDDQDQKLR